MRIGKLPPDLLHRLLSDAPITDPRVLIGPGIGEDAAVISMSEDRVLVAKTDPITFASDEIGWYSVHVNANDIAATGAEPRWFLATLLVPENMPESQIEKAFRQIADACKDIGVSLIGGHTEVTYDIRRPIVMGAMLGEAHPSDLTPTSAAQVGDAILLTKAIAIEGSAVLARESASILAANGVPDSAIETARGFLYDPGISVLKDARNARAAGKIHSMHDPTEGGLITGLREIGWAAGGGQDKPRRYSHPPRDPGLLPKPGPRPPWPPRLRGPGHDPVSRASPLRNCRPGACRDPRYSNRCRHPPEDGFVMITSEGEREMPDFPIDELARFLSSLPADTYPPQ